MSSPDVEEQHGRVQENGEHFNRRCKGEFFDAIGKVRTYTRSFRWRVRPIGDLHVSPSSLLHEGRPQRTCGTHTETDEPERVDAHSRSGRLEGSCVGKGERGGRGRAITSEGGQLLRDLSK